MKIGTYNLEFLFDEGVRRHSGKEYTFTKEFADSRVDYFAKEFAKINADILFLQELGSESILQRIIKKVDAGYHYFIAEPDKYGVGNAVIYKDIGCNCESIPTNTAMPVFTEGNEDALGSQIWSRRDFVKMRTMYKERTLCLLGIHIKANFLVPETTKDGAAKPMKTQTDKADGIIRSELFRFNQARKARQVIDALFTDDIDTAAIVAGDFNSREGDKLFRIIKGENKGAHDELVSVSSSEAPIDHILVSKNIEGHVVSVDIPKHDIFDHKSDPRFPYIVESDHAPIILVI
jgi:hypothetical protein